MRMLVRLVLVVLSLTTVGSFGLAAQEPPIGLQTTELRLLQSYAGQTDISTWYSTLSSDAQRILGDRTLTVFVIRPDGSAQYRIGHTTSGNRYRLSGERLRPQDYQLLRNHLNQPPYSKLRDWEMMDPRDPGYQTVTNAVFAWFSDHTEGESRRAHMAFLGDRIKQAGPEVWTTLDALYPEMMHESLSALALLDKEKVENIRAGRFEIGDFAADAPWGAELLRALKGRDLTGGEEMLSVELEPGVHGFVRIAPGVDVRGHDPIVLIQRGQLELFVGRAASSDVIKVAPQELMVRMEAEIRSSGGESWR